MPVEVKSNRIKSTKQVANRNARAAVQAGVDTGVAAARRRVPRSNLQKPHLEDTIEGTVTERRDRIEGVYSAGDPGKGIDYPWFVEAGTRSEFDPPDVVEDYPPSGGGEGGNAPQPYMGPSYEEGRVEVLRRATRILG